MKTRTLFAALVISSLTMSAFAQVSSSGGPGNGSLDSQKCRMLIPSDLDQPYLGILSRKFTLVPNGEAHDFKLSSVVERETISGMANTATAKVSLRKSDSSLISTTEGYVTDQFRFIAGDSKLKKLALKEALRKLPKCKDGGLHF